MGRVGKNSSNEAIWLLNELLAKVTYSVIPAKAVRLRRTGRASLARNDNFLLLSRVLQEDQMASEPDLSSIHLG